MATITDFSDDAVIPSVDTPSAAQLYTMLIANEQALRLAIFGDREGAMMPHDHAAKGGRTLGRALATATFGPYSRPGAGLSPTVGIPVYPLAAGVTSYQTSPKLFASFAVYIPGGVNGVAVRVGGKLLGAGTRSVQVRATLRPFSKVGLIPTFGGITGLGTLTTTGANNYVSVRIQLATLASMGDPNTGRWFELSLWAVSDPTAGSTFRLLGARVLPVVAASTPPPHVVGLPLIAMQVSEIIQGSYIVEKVIGKAARMLDGLIIATLGRVPGKLSTSGAPVALTDRASRWRASLDQLSRGIHQHTGKRYFDGAVIPWQLSAACYAGNLGDDAASTSDGTPYRGAKINPAGATDTGGVAPPPPFRLRASVARGSERIIVRAAIAAQHSSKQGNVGCYVRVWPSYHAEYGQKEKAPDGTLLPNNGVPSSVISLEHCQKLEALSAYGVYRLIYLEPEDGDIWVANSVRNSQGLVGHWTDDALLPDSSTPGARFSASNNYRVSKPIYIKIDTYGRTVDVLVDMAFIMSDQAGTIITTSTLQWLAIGAVEGA